MHICYGYGIEANTAWKKTLGSEWRQYEQTFPLLQASTIDQVSLECHNSRVPMELIGLLDGKDVMVGAIDVTTGTSKRRRRLRDTIREALKYVPRTICIPAPTAAWCRSPGKSPKASCGPWRRARPCQSRIDLII